MELKQFLDLGGVMVATHTKDGCEVEVYFDNETLYRRYTGKAKGDRGDQDKATTEAMVKMFESRLKHFAAEEAIRRRLGRNKQVVDALTPHL